MRKMIRYIKFLWKSTNKHGVHSPYVFLMITKCLYAKRLIYKEDIINYPKIFSKKQWELIVRLLRYYPFENVLSDTEISPLKEQYKLDVVNGESKKTIYDFVILSDISKIENPSKILDFLSNDGLWLCTNIHQAKNRELWEDVVQSEKCTVVIDFYHSGLLSTRKEQQKQRFTIRF